MTAIAGIWNLDGRPEAGRSCARMLRALLPYGPHGVRQWDADTVALGRRLWRLVPEDAWDQQPLTGGGGRYVLVADLRLDNRDEIARNLGLSEAGRRLCDAAILLSAWERWEQGCLDHLVGDFAFALWDGKYRQLFLARDHIGARPLFLHRGKRFSAFASMAKGLHALPQVPYAPNEEFVAEFLALLPAAEAACFFKDIERITPGTLLTIAGNGAIGQHRYWNPGRTRGSLRGPEEYSEALRHHLDEAVRCRLRGGGATVAAHLSGGFDSAAVATSAAMQLAPSGGKVIAFTAVPRPGYDGPDPPNRFGDEGILASKTASQHSNIEHVRVHGGDAGPLDDLDRTFFAFERPGLNLCNQVWGYAIMTAARERGLSVLLHGQMGNMTLSYDGHEALPEALRAGRWNEWRRLAGSLAASGSMSWRNIATRSIGPWIPVPVWQALNRIRGRRFRKLTGYSAVHPGAIDAFALARKARERQLDFAYRPWSDGIAMRLWVMRRAELGNFQKGALALWGIDNRDPTADRRLIEFCLSVPTGEFVRNGMTRALARRALADRIPAEVLGESRKGYQAVDWHERLTASRQQVAAELDRITNCGPAARVIDIDRLRALIANWPAGEWEREAVIQPYRLALLRGISAGHFLRRASGGNH